MDLNLVHRPTRLSHCFSIADLRYLAWRKLPAPLFHYLDGGADDEVTLDRNSTAFDRYGLMPRALRGISAVDMSTTVLGRRISVPLLCSPTGMSRLFHVGAESAVARAAARSNVFYSLSIMATTSLEEIAQISDGPKMFQIYIFRDKGLTRELIERCAAARYDALCLTIDTPVAGNRARDHITGMLMPPRFTIKSLASFATHPRWSWDYLRNRNFNIENVAHRVDALASKRLGVIEYVNTHFDRTAGWNDAADLRHMWRGAFAVKGVQSVVDAEKARDIGATAVIISNHGGRQLDGTLAPVDLVQRIRDVLGNDIEIIVDGGVRRGNHILKALALGANACSIGRAYLYGLSAAGGPGVARALKLLSDELQRGMELIGAASIRELVPDLVERL